MLANASSKDLEMSTFAQRPFCLEQRESVCVRKGGKKQQEERFGICKRKGVVVFLYSRRKMVEKIAYDDAGSGDLSRHDSPTDYAPKQVGGTILDT